MSQQNKEKINRLILSWPSGTIRTAATLRTFGISSSLARKYVQGGWLEPVNPSSRGAYLRAGDRVDWTGALHAVQESLGDQFYAGGRTALELQGFAHYISTGTREVFLFGPARSKLPPWLTTKDWGARIIFTATALFPHSSAQLVSAPVRDYSIWVAPPELAALEMLLHVPRYVGFDEAGQIMAGLVALRPSMAQKYLEDCGNIKAKRLFLYFAQVAGHAWLSSLDLSQVVLGSGNRQIVKGGVLDKKYRITVPRQGEEGEVLF
jgi:hypothetical protein